MNYQSSLDKLKIKNTKLYSAGFPGYIRNFSRDSLIYGLLSSDEDALLAQIDYSAQHQGKNSNPDTGEEPGKIHHELPSGTWRGRPTSFNACDTTDLFLIAVSVLYVKGNIEITDKYKDNILAAVNYILSHLKDDIFIESPVFCGADSFGLRVTYWKDSVISADKEEPKYPIAYSLVHFQTAYALQRIGLATRNNDLLAIGKHMEKAGIEKFWREDHFVVAIDDEGDIDRVSSDSLHSLLYLHPNELSLDQINSIIDYSKKLETSAGYLSNKTQSKMQDDYHTRYIWVFEQALLHAAARKHSLEHPSGVAYRVLDFLNNGYPELLDSENGYKPSGNNPQLWTLGAYKYFNEPQKSLIYKL